MDYVEASVPISLCAKSRCIDVPLELLIAMSAPGAAPPTAAAEIERILRELTLADRGLNASRNGALLGCLFGIQRPSAATMAEAGRLFVVSTEGVRQICGHFRRLALEMRVSSALLSIVCDRVRTSSMVTRDALEMRLSAVLGAGPTLEQVLAFCEYILDLPPLRATAAVRIHGSLRRSPLFIAEPRHIDALRVVTRAARRASASQCVGEINGLIRLMHEHLADPSAAELEAIVLTGLTQMRDFHWLDRENGLFFLQAAQRCDPVLRAAHQIIAVARCVPNPDSLVTGIERTRWWRYALPLDAPIRSKPILLAYLRARGVFERHPPELRAAEHRALLRRTLSGGEFAVYLVLAEPSWATRKEVMAAAACARLKSATLHGALCHAPWIEHPCRGCYAIVGSSQRSTADSVTLAQEPKEALLPTAANAEASMQQLPQLD